jgi:hypothetical protein
MAARGTQFTRPGPEISLVPSAVTGAFGDGNLNDMSLAKQSF